MIGIFHSARGKIILLGEHAVVHGHPALAAALDRGIRCSFDGQPSGGIRLAVPQWDLSVTAGDDHPVARAVTVIAKAVGADHLSLDLRAITEIPAGAGLGSSAALSVVLAKALCYAAGRDLKPDEIEDIAGLGEACFHSRPSGVDVALANRGGIGVFVKGAGLRAISVPGVSVVVGLSGELRSTGAMVERVRLSLEQDASAKTRLDELGACATHGIDALQRGDLRSLATDMNEAQANLSSFGLSTLAIDSMIAEARAAGALGAKLTGAGGGGAVIALAPGIETKIADAWRTQGYQAFVARLGGDVTEAAS